MTERYLDANRIWHHYTQGTITGLEHEALHLHDIKNMSYRQIALGLGLAPTTIADRITRARQKIDLAERLAS